MRPDPRQRHRPTKQVPPSRSLGSLQAPMPGRAELLWAMRDLLHRGRLLRRHREQLLRRGRRHRWVAVCRRWAGWGAAVAGWVPGAGFRRCPAAWAVAGCRGWGPIRSVAVSVRCLARQAGCRTREPCQVRAARRRCRLRSTREWRLRQGWAAEYRLRRLQPPRVRHRPCRPVVGTRHPRCRLPLAVVYRQRRRSRAWCPRPRRLPRLPEPVWVPEAVLRR